MNKEDWQNVIIKLDNLEVFSSYGRCKACVYESNCDEHTDCNEGMAEIMAGMSNAVNHPSYYTDGKIEVSDFIADKNLNFFRGNVVKYVARAGKKDPSKEAEDLKKAQWYIGREIERLERKA